MENQINKKPVKVFSCGAVKAAIWADSRVVNNTVVEVHSIKIDRAYKDKDNNEWRHSNTFFGDDLLKVSLVAQEAYKYIRLRSFEPESETDRNDGVPQNEQNSHF
jgi:hypothetical protein